MSRPLLSYLRIAVTSRCNLRCVYCQPACGVEGTDVLTKGEIVQFVRLAVQCGIEKVRVTGGEPLIRGDIVDIVREVGDWRPARISSNVVLPEPFGPTKPANCPSATTSDGTSSSVRSP